jgi:hypothetical protein
MIEAKRREVVDPVFGAEGLRPGLLKMFLDVWQQPEPGAAFIVGRRTAHGLDTRATTWRA